MGELDQKTERCLRLCRERSLAAVILSTQANFAWITGGHSNRIDSSTESGNGAIVVTANGRRLLVANAIEMPRLLDELPPGTFDAVEYPWTLDFEEPGHLVRQAGAVSGPGAVGTDATHAGALPIAAEIMRTRTPLTPEEADRYRALGRDLGAAIGALCRTIEPGAAEREVARRCSDAAAAAGARAVVILVAADERIARFRHPVPTDERWRRLLLLVVCAERHGLVVALSRLISQGPLPEDLTRRTRATAVVFERLLQATKAGARGSDLFAAAARAYAAQGFEGEERRHHQGGAIGYRSRDWIAHPASEESVHARQAFAWNPSITGTKVEDTALLFDGKLEMITATPGWPSIPVVVDGREHASPDVLERD